MCGAPRGFARRGHTAALLVALALRNRCSAADLLLGIDTSARATRCGCFANEPSTTPLAKRLVRGTAKWWTRRLDPKWSKAARARTPCCEKCGRTTGVLHAHHIIGRANKKLRWDLRNACVLCYYHHYHWAETNPLAFADWIRAVRPKDVAHIEAVQFQPAHHSSINYEAIEAELTAVLEGQEPGQSSPASLPSCPSRAEQEPETNKEAA